MAIVNLEVPFSDISGSLVKQGIINRRKLYRDENGKVVHRGKQEAYAVRHPRDYKKKTTASASANLIEFAQLAEAEFGNIRNEC